MTARIDQLSLDQLVGAACRVVGARRDVGGITVVPGRRLSYGELARAREHAAACGVRLTMEGTGVVRLTRRGAGEAAPIPDPDWSVRHVAEARGHGPKSPTGGPRDRG